MQLQSQSGDIERDREVVKAEASLARKYHHSGELVLKQQRGTRCQQLVNHFEAAEQHLKESARPWKMVQSKQARLRPPLIFDPVKAMDTNVSLGQLYFISHRHDLALQALEETRALASSHHIKCTLKQNCVTAHVVHKEEPDLKSDIPCDGEQMARMFQGFSKGNAFRSSEKMEHCLRLYGIDNFTASFSNMVDAITFVRIECAELEMMKVAAHLDPPLPPPTAIDLTPLLAVLAHLGDSSAEESADAVDQSYRTPIEVTISTKELEEIKTAVLREYDSCGLTIDPTRIQIALITSFDGVEINA